MQIVVIGDVHLFEALIVPGVQTDKVLHFYSLDEIKTRPNVIFYLYDEEKLDQAIPQLLTFNCLVIVNAVIKTLQDLPVNFCRINAWNGFLERPLLEVVTTEANKPIAEQIFSFLQRPVIFVADEVGMIAATSIAMIINEAHYALSDGVSTEEEIDLAMKLGTNYPFGPFEWCKKIGRKHIADLLLKLGETDPVYQPAFALL